MLPLDELRLLGHVALAAVLGGFIGAEREQLNKPAGLRTHILLGSAAALLVSLGEMVVLGYAQDVATSVIRADPLRVINAVITGVSFLGAGTIIRGRDGHVGGLTTASSLLLTAAVGIAVAERYYVLAVGVTATVLVTLRGLSGLSEWLNRSETTESHT